MENIMSENKKIFLAIENARAKGFSELKKSGTNPAFRSKYSTLQDVFDACKKPLEENGVHISFTTDAIVVDNRVENILVCRLLHLESGEMLESKVSCLDDTKKGSQAIGSGISYMRRYLLQSMLNLECDPETDDDGNATTVQANQNTKQDDVTVFTSPDTVEHPFKIVSPTGEVKAGKNTVEQLLEIFQTFVVDCDNKESLHRFWKQNKVAVSLIEEKDTNLYKQLRASFDEQGEKIKKNGKWS